MSELHVVDHPVVCANLAKMRRADTSSSDFRNRLRATAFLLGYEAARDLPTKMAMVKTPVASAAFRVPSDTRFFVVAILRAGIGMIDGMLDLLPNAAVGFIGMQRDEETHKPREYYLNLPAGMEDAPVFVVDPMLATGGSAIDAVSRLKQHGCRDIRFVCLLAAPEGVRAFGEAHPDVDVYAAALDECLDANAYIVPGLGDAGDRIFDTV